MKAMVCLQYGQEAAPEQEMSIGSPCWQAKNSMLSTGLHVLSGSSCSGATVFSVELWLSVSTVSRDPCSVVVWLKDLLLMLKVHIWTASDRSQMIMHPWWSPVARRDFPLCAMHSTSCLQMKYEHKVRSCQWWLAISAGVTVFLPVMQRKVENRLLCQTIISQVSDVSSLKALRYWERTHDALRASESGASLTWPHRGISTSKS